MKEFLKGLIKLFPIPLTKNIKYDRETQKIIAQLNPGSNCIDVGCYKGEILDLVLVAAPEGNHFAVEPVPNQFDFLQKKYASIKNCTVFNYAASNSKGESEFNYVISNPSYSGLIKRDYDRDGEEDMILTVKTELLDNLIPENMKIDLIKIDVEGGELQVLQGAKNILENINPW